MSTTLADYTPRMPWGDKEIARFSFRTALFQKRGLPEPEADTLADRLYERDFERDDRRVCIECKHALSATRCARRQPVLLDILQRCHLFNWEMPA
jgi:hypothetical protein